MSHSRRFIELFSRIKELRRHMLPVSFSNTGDYSPQAQDLARGFRLLAHAEIEAYIEEMSKNIVIEKIREWKRNKTPSNLLLSFLSCYHSGWRNNDEKHNSELLELAKSRKPIKASTNDIIDQAQNQFIKKLKKNNGIRENNLYSLILPTGIELSDLDQAWITDMDDFGKQRGDTAHNSKGTTESINPKDELSRVKCLLIGLKELDIKFTAID